MIIATDGKEIAEVAEGFGAAVCMTSSDHQSGTERIAEAVVALGVEDDELVICLQGDELFISPQVIRQLAEDLDKHDNVKVSHCGGVFMALYKARVDSRNEAM